ncbi:MAG: alanine--tRNA ligase, partial [Candidatus Eremiobacteraeota bacterium]|nr:alanine--tRNA ligase [Candidatus Eremiobacteraeota bacterium]
MKSHELRFAFIEFFTARGHKLLPPASLIPHEMSTTLFTIAGMEQFVPVFLGEIPPPAPRAVTVQPCLRVAGAKSDIENVGRTGRHGTFLEMLGNFSFGDYYKREAIAYAWDFVVQTLKFEPHRLAVTVHTSDDEAALIWRDEIGLPEERITRFDQDNFWTMGATGPCGPCTEIFYDTGETYASDVLDVGPNLGNRFVEFWNIVFQQYNRDAAGKLTELPRKSIDTGAGFERILALVNDKASMYETDLFTSLIAAQPTVSTSSLLAEEQLVRRNIIADHGRAVTFLINDGVYPSNTDRGYVLRFLIRRAVRNGRLLGYPSGFFSALVPAVVDSLGSGYPELQKNITRIQDALCKEEQTFERTLQRGSDMLAQLIDKANDSTRLISGHDAFTLHDTFGFPIELTREIAAERGAHVQTEEFDAAMDEQRARARADSIAKRLVSTVTDVPAIASDFMGYEGLEAQGEILALMRMGAPVPELNAAEEGQVVLDKTSFYAERGGQIGDRGTIKVGSNTFEVFDTQFIGEAIAHHGIMRNGALHAGEVAFTSVAAKWREEIRRHHTSAHLLQRALKDVLGDEVLQAGSWVGTDRMRFDFRSPGGALTADQRREVSHRVNQMIREDTPLQTEVLP